MGQPTVAQEVTLPVRATVGLRHALSFLGTRAIPGVEAYVDGTFVRTVPAPGGPALAHVTLGADSLTCALRLHDAADRDDVLGTLRRLLDLDADTGAIDAALAAHGPLAPLVEALPGIRSPGAADAFEMAVRAVVGQQISVAGARTVLGRIVAEHGAPALDDGTWRLFPSAERFAAIDPATLPMPRARGRALVGIAAAIADGALKLDGDPADARAALLALPGVGPWTADYLRMRVLGDPDVLLATDLGVRKAAAGLGIGLDDPHAEWAPWRSYVTHHLWASLH